MVTEGHERDLTWTQTLPNDALRCYVKHYTDLGRSVKGINRRGELVRFRKMGAVRCEGEINSRLVSVVATGKFFEIQNAVTNA